MCLNSEIAISKNVVVQNVGPDVDMNSLNGVVQVLSEN